MASATLTRPTTSAVKAISNVKSALPLTVSWRLDDQPNTAEISIPKKRFHEFRQFWAGKEVYIKARKNFRDRLLFHGFITSRYFDFHPESENVSVVCQGPRWKLGADFLKGQYLLNKDGQYRVLSGRKLIFNEVLPRSTIAPQNASSTVDSDGVRLFSLDPRTDASAQAWTVKEMLWYCWKIGREAKDPLADVIGECLKITEFGIGSLGDLELYDVDVDGMTVLDAFTTIFKRAGLRWWCRPSSTTKSELVAFLASPLADRPKKWLYLADVGTGVSPACGPGALADIGTSTNNVEAGRLNEDFSEVANEIFAYGARKKFQQEFTLVPGWEWATWTTLSTQSTETIRAALRESTSPNWELYRDVGRKWILDESGAVSGTAYDFSSLFGSQEWAALARPFLGQLVDGTRFQSPQVENPSNSEWETIEMAARLLEDQAGIYLEGDEIAAPIMCEGLAFGGGFSLIATMATELKITVAVEEDQCLEKNSTEDDAQTVFRWLVPATPNSDAENSEVIRRLGIVVDSEYETDNQNTDKTTAVEADLQDLVDRKLEENKNPRVSSSFSIPWICTTYEPGDIVRGIRGRDLYFDAQIIEVRFELGEIQRTELILEDVRLAQT